MKVDGMEDSVRVRPIDAIESRIDGEFEGWSGDTTFRLQNGQLWEQASYAYWYHYAYCPEVIIYDAGGYRLFLADDHSNSISVRRIG